MKKFLQRHPQLGVVLLFLILWLLFAYVTNIALVSERDKQFDFFPRWYGAREMLAGNDPYALEVNNEIQKEMDIPLPDRVPGKHNFLYPATITYTLLPFWLIPFDVAISLWSGLYLLVCLALPLLIFTYLNWQIKPSLLIAVTFFSLIYHHSLNNYVLGQFMGMILLLLILAWWMIDYDRPWLAAVALIIATMRPDGIIFAGAMLFDLLLKRRFRLIAIWGTMMASLFALSVAQIGFWIPDFLDRVDLYRECCLYTEPADAIGVDAVAYALIVGTVIWAGWLLWQMRPLPDKTRIPWSLAVVIIAYLLVFTQSKDYTLIYLLLPAWLIVWAGRGRWLSTGAVILMLLSPWLFQATQATIWHENPIEQLVAPIIWGALLTAHWIEWRRDASVPDTPHAT